MCHCCNQRLIISLGNPVVDEVQSPPPAATDVTKAVAHSKLGSQSLLCGRLQHNRNRAAEKEKPGVRFLVQLKHIHLMSERHDEVWIQVIPLGWCKLLNQVKFNYEDIIYQGRFGKTETKHMEKSEEIQGLWCILRITNKSSTKRQSATCERWWFDGSGSGLVFSLTRQAVQTLITDLILTPHNFPAALFDLRNFQLIFCGLCSSTVKKN